jgi:hypothetical protein
VLLFYPAVVLWFPCCHWCELHWHQKSWKSNVVSLWSYPAPHKTLLLWNVSVFTKLWCCRLNVPIPYHNDPLTCPRPQPPHLPETLRWPTPFVQNLIFFSAARIEHKSWIPVPYKTTIIISLLTVPQSIFSL